MGDIDVPVLIVGGSLVGMSAALLLAQHGIRALGVEQHHGTAIHPRAAHATQRTMEIFRGVGLEPVIRERSAAQFVQNGGVLAVGTLVGGATTQFIADLNADVRDVSPSERVFLSQNALEPLLKQRAEELGAGFRFGTEVIDVEQDTEVVTARLRARDSQEISTVRSRYLVAADGAHSRIRERLGIGMRGHATFSRSVTIYFRANLRPLLQDKQWAVVYVNNDKLRGFFRFEKPFDHSFLVVNTTGDPAHPTTDVSSGLDDDGALDLVRIALGTSDIPVTVENVMRWSASAEFATRFRAGRVFIAGDAAHVMPPTGGFGGNTGVQDAHNLAWKLALVLSGRAQPALLDSYECERAPVAALTVEQAYTRYVLRTAPDLLSAAMMPLAHDLDVELGYVYRSPAIASEEPDNGLLHVSPRESRGRPGTRAPHIWIERDGERISTIDLYGRRFVLLGGSEAQEWCRYAELASGQAGVELDVYRASSERLKDLDGSLAAAHGIEPSGCILVRPDGFVAWRSRSGEPASARTLSTVLARFIGAT
jgi:2-polyprenyl-6-methoxyphenol hydroxylase-like FAD-dependent oxidoreductase